MKTAEEIRKEIFSSETEGVIKVLEELDINSKALASAYINALADKQKVDEMKVKAIAV